MERRTLLTSYAAPFASPRDTRDTKATAPGARANYFPNCELQTHEGKTVRFYDDLIHGDKIVLFNFMYAQCTGICPGMTANLVRVQKLLGARVGRDIFMHSITLKPDEDKPADLKMYVEMHGVKAGWLFLTGQRDDIEVLRRKLGFRDPNPTFDKDVSQHIGLVRFGNESIDRWAACPALANPEQIAKSVLWMQSTNTHTGA
ncbi:MAG: SCO family protein [Pyrinomonadaceae bacterium]